MKSKNKNNFRSLPMMTALVTIGASVPASQLDVASSNTISSNERTRIIELLKTHNVFDGDIDVLVADICV